MAGRYNALVIDHFTHPRNVGELDQPDGVGAAGDPHCGDYMKVWIKVDNERISAIRFRCKGCPTAIAVGSIMTELARGKHLDDAVEISDDAIAQAIGGLPPDKAHCSNLGTEALLNAVGDYITGSIERGRVNFV